MGKQKKIFIISILISTLLNILVIVINIENAALTLHSIPALAFMLCSIIYAMIAYGMKDSGNLLLIGNDRLFWIICRSFENNEYHTSFIDYEKEFRRTLFIYCVFIPCYIPIAFLSKSFPSWLLSILSLLLIQELLIMSTFIVLRWTSLIKAKRNQELIDEQLKKEQEKRESMGKWK